MIARAVAVLLLALSMWAPAAAQNNPSGYGSCLIATSAAVTCVAAVSGGGTASGYITGVENISLTAQTVTVTCTANGVAVKEIAILGPTQVINYTLPGTQFTGNLVCTPSGAPTAPNNGDGIVVYYRRVQ